MMNEHEVYDVCPFCGAEDEFNYCDYPEWKDGEMRMKIACVLCGYVYHEVFKLVRNEFPSVLEA